MSGRLSYSENRAAGNAGGDAPVADRSSRDPLRLTIAAVIFLTISRAHQHFGFLAPLRPALVLVGLAAITAFLRPQLLGRTPLLATWPVRMVLAIAGMACFATVGGISIGGSAAFLLQDYFKTILLFLLIVATTRGVADLVLYTWALVLGAAFQVYLALFFFQVQGAYGSATLRLGDLYMFDANDIGCVLLVSLPLCALLAQTHRGLTRLGCILLMVGIGSAIAKSGSRGAFVGLVVTCTALLVSLRGVSVARRVGVVIVLGLGVALSTPPGYWKQMETILRPKNDYNWTSADGRKAIWNRGIGYMLEYPLAGLGPNNFSRAECTIGPKAQTRVYGTGIMCAAPHNTYLQAAAEMGVPGGLLWITMILRGIMRPRRLRRWLSPAWEHNNAQARFIYLAGNYLSISMLAFAVSTAFVSFAYLDLVYLILALMAGLSIAQARAGARSDARGTSSMPATPATYPVESPVSPLVTAAPGRSAEWRMMRWQVRS